MSDSRLQKIENIIYIIRGQKVMLDSDLAELYGVLTKNLNKAVQRNRLRFPKDFMFQLTTEEMEPQSQGMVGEDTSLLYSQKEELRCSLAY